MRLFALLMLMSLPVLIDRGAVFEAAALHALAEGDSPYFVPAYGILLYVRSPLVTMSACVFLLTPGLLLAAGLHAADDLGRWLLTGLGISIIIVSTAASAVQSALEMPLSSGAFVSVVMMCSFVSLAFLLVRTPRGAHRINATPAFKMTIAITCFAIWALLATLSPKIYWENLNGDGVHAYESSRLLLHQPLPFWSKAAGDIASFPGVTSMLFAFPASWFIRLFGECEASIRLSFALYLAVLYFGLLSLIEHARPTPLTIVQRALIWLPLLAYTLAMSYSATYDPYAADMALPATQDTLMMACFIGFLISFVRRQMGWLLLFTSLTYVSAPGGGMLIAFWLVAAVAAARPRPWRMVAVSAIALVTCVVCGVLFSSLLARLNQPVPGSEYAFGDMLGKFRFIQLTDFRRFAFWAVPCGLLPVVAMCAWRVQDSLSRLLTILVVGHFLFFYIQAYTSLHYYVPEMILPVVVLWRCNGFQSLRWRFILTPAVAACGILAIYLSIPNNYHVYTEPRRFASQLDNRIGGYEVCGAEGFRASTLLNRLIDYDWNPDVPQQAYGGSPLVWYFYAQRRPLKATSPNYILQRSGDPLPSDMTLIAEGHGAAVYVKDPLIWQNDRAQHPPSPAGNRLFHVPRDQLFRGRVIRDGPHVWDLAVLAGLRHD